MNVENGIVVYHGCLPRITTDLTTNSHTYNNRVAIEGIIYELKISSTNLQLYEKDINGTNTSISSVFYIDMIDMDLIYDSNRDIDSILNFMENYNVCIDNIPIKEYLKKLKLYSDVDDKSDTDNTVPNIIFTEMQYTSIDNNPISSNCKFVYDGKFGEFSVKMIDGKLHCYVKLDYLSAKWIYKGDVLYTEFYDSEDVSRFKEALCSEIFPYGLPIVLSNGSYSR
jgi:hypothetical protein